MRRVCSWCGTEMDPVEGSVRDGPAITHGLCLSCADDLFSHIGIPLPAFLDELESPVVVVDESGTVQSANHHARALLKKELSAIEGFKGGDVFECAYATLPGGCGQTVHCSGCTIRNAVMKTHSTGQSLDRVPAYLNRASPEGIHRLHLRISTRKLEDVVVLRIDQICEP